MVKAASNVPLSNGSVSPPEWMKRLAGLGDLDRFLAHVGNGTQVPD
jgi:hypothetical protein